MAAFLGLLLGAASLSKLWSERFPQPPPHSWRDSAAITYFVAVGEAVLGFVLLAGLWTRPTWLATAAIFSLFAIIAAVESLQGKDSCGCFGTIQVRPIYTMSLDLATVALLLITGTPERGSEVLGRRSAKRQRIIASAIGIVWVGIVLGMWLTKPMIAVPTTAIEGQTFGKPGELVVLEPEKWPGQRFSLADHIDIGSQLLTGQWIILLVHHDCDRCAAAVRKYVALHSSFIVPPSSFPEPPSRLAIIEMPPFADSTDPPPWQLPPSVLSGRLDETRDWFATTPVAITIKDGLIISAKESTAAESPGP